MNIQFAVHSYQARALPLSAQRAVNLYAEQQPADAKSRVPLNNAPGIVSVATAGSSTDTGRGAHTMAGTLYVVIGTRLYSVSRQGVTTDLGEIAGSGRVSMDDNGSQLCIVNGSEGYIYRVAGGLAQITDPDFRPADTVTYQDGYFIFNESGTGNFFISNLLDGFAYTATDFANAEGASDNVVAVFSNHREIWVFGELTTEIYFNSGDTDFPFDRIAGSFIERGCAAPHSVTRLDNTLIWLGEDRIVYRAQGYTPQRISQHAIEHAIEAYSTISDAFAFSFTMAGHKFYVLTFPTEGATWVWDASTSLWHERLSFGMDRWRVNGCAKAYDRYFVIDSQDGRVGRLDENIYTEYGGTIQGSATSAPLHSDRKRMFMRRFELDIETGVGLTSGQGSDPQIWLDWSDDGGRTWSKRKPWQSMGKRGAYRQRLRWNRMGSFRNRVLRLNTSDPVKRTGIAAHAELSLGTS